jgi:hypothetical protein
LLCSSLHWMLYMQVGKHFFHRNVFFQSFSWNIEMDQVYNLVSMKLRNGWFHLYPSQCTHTTPQMQSCSWLMFSPSSFMEGYFTGFLCLSSTWQLRMRLPCIRYKQILNQSWTKFSVLPEDDRMIYVFHTVRSSRCNFFFLYTNFTFSD